MVMILAHDKNNSPIPAHPHKTEQDMLNIWLKIHDARRPIMMKTC